MFSDRQQAIRNYKNSKLQAVAKKKQNKSQ